MSYFVRCKYVVSGAEPPVPVDFCCGTVKDYAIAKSWHRDVLRFCSRLLDDGKIISYDLSIEIDGGAGNE